MEVFVRVVVTCGGCDPAISQTAPEKSDINDDSILSCQSLTCLDAPDSNFLPGLEFLTKCVK